MPRRHLIAALGVLAIATACTGGSAETTSPPTTIPDPPSTTTSTTTTTTVPAFEIQTDGVDRDIDGLVTQLYQHLATAAAPPPLPAGLAAHIEAAGAGPATVSTTTIARDLKYGERVAVVIAGDDVILLADDTNGWQIVGADLPSVGLDPWFGPAMRTVLIIGSDARWNETVEAARSDSLHILTAVPAKGAGAIVGIPRDSWVVTPSGGRGKITNILANHGVEGTFETVSRIADMEIEGWIMTGFLGFDILSENFGPFEIDLPIRVPRGSGFPGFPAGPQTVEPSENLLLLARIRKTLPNGDFDRSRNHGVIMQGALREVQRRGIEMLPDLLVILNDVSFTSFSAGEMLNLGATAFLLDPDLVDNAVIPGSVGTTSGGASIVRIGSGAETVFADQEDDGILNDSSG